MANYEVEITRTYNFTAIIEIHAKSKKEAKAIALKMMETGNGYDIDRYSDILPEYDKITFIGKV